MGARLPTTTAERGNVMEFCKICGRLLELYKLTNLICYVCKESK